MSLWILYKSVYWFVSTLNIKNALSENDDAVTTNIRENCSNIISACQTIFCDKKNSDHTDVRSEKKIFK